MAMEPEVQSETSRQIQAAELTPVQQRALLAQLLQAKAAAARKFPMSAGQQGLWHAFRRDPQATQFNVFLPTRVRSQLDANAMRQAVELVSRRHASLRATFSDAAGTLTCEIHDDLLPEFTVHQLGGASDAEVTAAIAEEMRRPFDLESGPLIRIGVYQLASDDWIILAATHHIVVDFWSLILILGELRQAYPAFAQGTQPSLPPALSNYAEFVRQQTDILGGERGQVLKNYWASEVAQAEPVIELPLDRIRPTRASHQAASVPLQFTSQTLTLLNRIAADNRVTAVAVIQSALQVFLGRYSGQESFFIGSPFSGRTHQKFEQTVGFFVNMLPLRADLSGDPSFVELTRRATRTLLRALEHETYPVAQIVQDANVTRDPSRSPLFQVSCTFEKSHLKEESGRAGFLFPDSQLTWDFGGLVQESFYVPHPTCHYDLEFVFEQTPSQLRGMICFALDLFDRATLVKMAANFESLLESLLHNAALPISRVPWSLTRPSTSAKRALQTNASVEPSNATVDGMIVQAALAQPERLAVRWGNLELTYGELAAQSERLARSLLALQIGRSDIVPVVAEFGPQAFIAALGVQRAGAAALLIDVTNQANHLSELLEPFAAPVTVLGTQQLAERLDLSTPVIALDQPAAFASASSSLPHNLPPLVPQHNAHDLAYLIFTSGSTGEPKAVAVEHAAVCNTLQWRKRAVPLTPADRTLLLLSHQFDASLAIAWTSWTQGATVCWPTSPVRQDPSAILDYVRTEQVSVLTAVPSLQQLLVAESTYARCDSLRQVWCGGELMPPSLPAAIRELLDVQIWNFYGPTEAAIEATACDVTHHNRSKPVPIGVAIDGAHVFIVDQHRRQLPDTVPGELAIGGRGLARGYWNNKLATDAVFVTDANTNINHGTNADAALPARVYLTGDRARINAEGQVEFLGRADQQIKLRGYRIELGEIEALLQTHAAVERAAVKVVGSEAAARLVAYVQLVPRAFATTDTQQRGKVQAELRRHSLAALPAYKTPAQVIVLERLPLTTSGKVDRRKLPDPQDVQAPAETPTIAPANVVESYLANAWQEILELESPPSTDVDFFSAGGGSLQAAMLAGRLSEDLQTRIPTALVFDLLDIASMASRLCELYRPALTQRFGKVGIHKILEQTTAPDNFSSSARAQNIGARSTSVRADAASLLTPLKTTGDLPPIFMVHPPGGIVICYRELANQLSSSRPMYGIRSRGLHGDEALPSSLAEMAADYIAAIRSVQASGPYVLGGWSLGGLCAYEMSQQLVAAGARVQRLVLLDSTIPEQACERVPANERVNVGREYGIDLTLAQLGALPAEKQLPFLWQHAKRLGVLQDDSPAEVVTQALEDLQALFQHHIRLASEYRLHPTSVPITLFRPTETPFELAVAEDRGWGHLSPEVTVHFVSGHHHSMVQSPNVEQIARQLG